MKRNVEIVKYSPEYREKVRECVYVTGFGGDDAGIYFDNRELFADFFTLYYTDYEPESGFIGLVDGEFAGYLIGCVDTRRFEETMKKIIYPQMLKKIITGEYRLGPKTLRNFSLSALMALRGEVANAPVDLYPAHLHIDLNPGFRRFGLGSRLMHTYFEYLRSQEVKGLHLGTSSAHVLSIPFYEKLGFQRYKVVRATTSIFKDFDGRDYYNVIFVRNLTDYS